MTVNCQCTHTHRSHYNGVTANSGHCGVRQCACPQFRRLLECADCGENLGVDENLADDEGAICYCHCGAEYARERADVRDETAYAANRDNELGVL